MSHSEPSLQSSNSLFITFPDVFNPILGGDNKPVIVRGDSPPFSLQDAAISVRPYLELLTKTLMILSYVIHYDILLTLVAIPPLVAQLRIVIRIVLSCLTGFTNPRCSPEPDTSKMITVINNHVILLDLLKVTPMLHLYVSRDV